jgi:response regulator RpfG family c-di-GMP phosphodiesterase
MVSNFCANLVGAIGENLKLGLLKKKNNEREVEDLQGQQERSRLKWERLTHFMLNINNIQNRETIPNRKIHQIDYLAANVLDQYGLSQDLVELLVKANFIEAGRGASQQVQVVSPF